MQLLGKLEFSSPQQIKKFLDQQHVGRIASIDAKGFPQIIPMNFVYINDIIYLHSHTKGEKLENITRDSKVGFEVDTELEFLPSYFEHPTDASLADTLYISIVIKGMATLVLDAKTKVLALNGLMEKYQKEGRYQKIQQSDEVLKYVSVIKITPESIRGKYKIGQHLDDTKRTNLAKKILKRNSKTAKETLHIMGFDIKGDNVVMSRDPAI